MAEEGEGNRTMRVLSRAEWFKVSEWIRTEADRLKGERPYWTELAEQVKGRLGIDAPPTTLKDMCGIIGLAWEPRAIVGKPASTKLHARMEALEKGNEELDKYVVQMRASFESEAKKLARILEGLAAEVAQMRGALNYIIRELGVKVPGHLNPLQVSDRVNANAGGK